ncbi:hypothetical protein BU25DRAFT_170428 [Macroventuria anomochaeta]|uniref:Uncharacterized protein n=1 Tax=Macroventuria anomochaeta TaxID=301207 RepID=A0ACB6RQC7_9PLEO|nr:uncharacterized protein BU25DRAFT_170428 [Macroventuria anomochaeta]KAF2623912.1 hypothetical protein BU25DRAFT_170428 [Macroventuria anomochaeta]
MARYAAIRQRPYDYDEPYKPLPRPRGGSAVPTTTKQEACGWWVGGEWIEQPPPKSYNPEQRSRLSPIIIDNGDDSDCYEVPPPAPQTAKASRASRSGRVFDFNNSEQALTWAIRRDDNQKYQVGFPFLCNSDHEGAWRHPAYLHTATDSN